MAETQYQPPRPEVVVRINPQQNPNGSLVWRVESLVGVGNFRPERRESDGEISYASEVSMQGFPAIWDTGANQTMVTPIVAKASNLIRTGTTLVGGVTGEPVRMGTTPLVIAMKAWTHNRTEPHHQFHIVENAIIMDSDSPEFGVLIGMDVIMRGDLELHMDRSGRRVMIWSTPPRRRAIRYPPDPAPTVAVG